MRRQRKGPQNPPPNLDKLIIRYFEARHKFATAVLAHEMLANDLLSRNELQHMRLESRFEEITNDLEHGYLDAYFAMMEVQEAVEHNEEIPEHLTQKQRDN